MRITVSADLKIKKNKGIHIISHEDSLTGDLYREPSGRIAPSRKAPLSSKSLTWAFLRLAPVK